MKHENPSSTVDCESIPREFQNLSRAQLIGRWKTFYGTIPPPRTSHDLMQRVLSYELQAKQFGGLPSKIKRRMAALETQRLAGVLSAEIQKPAHSDIKAGATLLREWNGKMHCVLVKDQGFEYSGQHYRSLSQIASHITGAHWSGPRFFGLNRGIKPSTIQESQI